MSVRQFWWCWAALLLVAIWALSAVDAGRNPQALVAARRPQPLPAVPYPPPPAEAQSELALLANSALWGAVAAAPAASAAASKPPAAQWYVSGVYSVAGERRLIVHHDGMAVPSVQLRVGEKLPDGALIVTIESSRVQVRAPASRRGSAGGLVWLPVNRVAASAAGS